MRCCFYTTTAPRSGVVRRRKQALCLSSITFGSNSYTPAVFCVSDSYAGDLRFPCDGEAANMRQICGSDAVDYYGAHVVLLGYGYAIFVVDVVACQ